MAKSITTVNTAADTFQILINRVNESINAISQEALTANNNANGAFVTGNSYLFGIFGANTITVYNALRGGNVQVANTLNITSNIAVTGTILTIGNSTVNNVINSVSVKLANGVVNSVLTEKSLTIGNLVANQTHVLIGNSTVNSVIGATNLIMSGNLSINATHLTIGNSTVNVTINSSTITVPNFTTINNISLSYLDVGNSTVNVYVNSSAIRLGAGVSLGQSTITLGNSTVNVFSNNVNLILGGNVVANQTHIKIGNSTVNATMNSSALQIGGTILSGALLSSLAGAASGNVTTTGTSAQLIDSFEMASYRGAEYLLSVADNVGVAYQVEKILLFHDGTDVDVTDYGILWSNVRLGTFTANANSTHVTVYVTPTTANTTIKFNRNTVSV